ncbi:MAG: hypothetical protein WC867_07270 [Candidatus Pacearchaeota archaeon]|jgi:translation initiation factor 2B subunit (eIF-2B alpha/beta/delta family)
MDNKSRFNQICKDIKSLKIQSATTLTKKAFYAYKLKPTENSKKKLLSLRPTEPMLYNILNKLDDLSYQDLIKKMEDSQDKINEEVFKLIKNNSIVFTHCHATSVTKALIYSKKKGKKFEVYNTETRPRYQGRKTSLELKKAGIKVTMFVDSAVMIALTNAQDKEEKTRPVDLVLLGADAITKNGVINKVGSGLFAKISKMNKIPFYIVSNSLKFSKKEIKFEQRNPKEIYNSKKIKIVNPAFEFIPKEDITGLISELGNLKYNQFLKKVN